MSKTLTIIARIEAKTESLNLVKQEVLKLIEPTRKEKGCIQYELHQDNEKPEIFIFFENWESQELWQTHMESSHLESFVKNTKEALADLTINQMSKIN